MWSYTYVAHAFSVHSAQNHIMCTVSDVHVRVTWQACAFGHALYKRPHICALGMAIRCCN
jgi:hypothetical protein